MRWIVALVAVLTGCADTPTAVPDASFRWEYPYYNAPCDLNTLGPSLDSLRRDSIPPRPSRTPDDRWAEFARDAPGGWGGFFHGNGRQNLYLTRPDEVEALLPQLRTLGFSVGPNPLILEGRWDFAQLYDWYNYLQFRGLWSVDGVHSSDIQEADNRLNYGITVEGLPSLARLLTDLGVPCGLVTADVGPNGARLTGS